MIDDSPHQSTDDQWDLSLQTFLHSSVSVCLPRTHTRCLVLVELDEDLLRPSVSGQVQIEYVHSVHLTEAQLVSVGRPPCCAGQHLFHRMTRHGSPVGNLADLNSSNTTTTITTIISMNATHALGHLYCWQGTRFHSSNAEQKSGLSTHLGTVEHGLCIGRIHRFHGRLGNFGQQLTALRAAHAAQDATQRREVQASDKELAVGIAEEAPP